MSEETRNARVLRALCETYGESALRSVRVFNSGKHDAKVLELAGVAGELASDLAAAGGNFNGMPEYRFRIPVRTALGGEELAGRFAYFAVSRISVIE